MYDYKCESAAEDEGSGLGDISYDLIDFPDAVMGEIKARIHKDMECISAVLSNVDKVHEETTSELDKITWLAGNSKIDFNESEESRNLRVRKLGRVDQGEIPVLVLSINGLDTSNEDDLSRYVFADDGETLTSTFLKCSQEKLRMIPSTEHDLIQDGVLKVNLDQNLIGEQQGAITNIVAEQVEGMLGISSLWDARGQYPLVVYCMPPGVISGSSSGWWASYAYVNNPKSVIRDCTTYGSLVHEIGHNLGECGKTFF